MGKRKIMIMPVFKMRFTAGFRFVKKNFSFRRRKLIREMLITALRALINVHRMAVNVVGYRNGN